MGTLICTIIAGACLFVVLILDSIYDTQNFETPYRVICLFCLGLTIYLVWENIATLTTYIKSRSYNPEKVKPVKQLEDEWFEVQ